MAISKIQYDDKVAINIDSTIPDINKCNASDLNEIKSVVNNNADEIPSNDNLVNVGTSVDTDYKTNILTTTNLFTGQLYNGIIGQDGVYEYGPARITMANKSLSNTLFIKKGTYTLSIDGLDFCTALTKDTNGNRIDNFANSWKPLPFTFTTTQDAYLYFSARKSDSSNINPNDYKPVLVEGNTAPSTYIPFINNTINVNNEKYSDTINVGTEINNKNKINVLYSHNLFDSTQGVVGYINAQGGITELNTNFASDYIKLEVGKNYTISLNTTANNIGVAFFNEGKTMTSRQNNNNVDKITLTALSKGYIRFWVEVDGTTTLNATNIANTYNVQFQEGSEALPYEPYIVPSINVDGEEIYNASKDVISIIGNPNYTISSTGAYEKVPLNIISSQIGNNFSLNNNNQIVCKKSGYIKINANINYTSINTSGVKWAGVFINNNNTITANSYGVASQRLTLSITTFLIKVNANDVIDVRVYGNQGDTIRNDNLAYTYLTCEYV